MRDDVKLLYFGIGPTTVAQVHVVQKTCQPLTHGLR